jgi:hypothetical protein
MWRRWRQLRGGRRFCWGGPRRDHFEDWGHHGILWLGCCTSPGGQGHESARCALPPAVTWSARATGQFDGYSRPQVSTVILRRLAGRSRVHVSLGWLRCPALPGASWYVLADSDEEKSDCKFAELVACSDQAAIMNSDAIKVRRALMSFAEILIRGNPGDPTIAVGLASSDQIGTFAVCCQPTSSGGGVTSRSECDRPMGLITA